MEEAERRGLPNIKSMVEAIPAFIAPDSIEVFEKFGVLSRVELESRVEIEYEFYAKTINIEARTMIDMACKQYIPAVIKYTTVLANSINSVKSACEEADLSVQTEFLIETSALLSDARVALAKLQEVTEKASSIKDAKERAIFSHDEVTTAMAALRAPIDQLEMIVAKDMWPVPSYGDLIFEV